MTRDDLIAELQKLPNTEVHETYLNDIIGYVELLHARAAQSDNLREENRYLRRLLVAIAIDSPQGVRVGMASWHAVAPGDDFQLLEDTANNEYVLQAQPKGPKVLT